MFIYVFFKIHLRWRANWNHLCEVISWMSMHTEEDLFETCPCLVPVHLSPAGLFPNSILFLPHFSRSLCQKHLEITPCDVTKVTISSLLGSLPQANSMCMFYHQGLVQLVCLWGMLITIIKTNPQDHRSKLSIKQNRN